MLLRRRTETCSRSGRSSRTGARVSGCCSLACARAGRTLGSRRSTRRSLIRVLESLGSRSPCTRSGLRGRRRPRSACTAARARSEPAADGSTLSGGRRAMHVFISHSRQNGGAALKLCDLLVERGCQAWLDVRELTGGSDWSEAVTEAIRSANGFVFLVGPPGSADRWQRFEWQKVAENEFYLDPDKPLVPIVIGDAELPGFLNTRQALRVGEAAIDFDALADRVVASLQNPAATVDAEKLARGREARRRAIEELKEYSRELDVAAGKDAGAGHTRLGRAGVREVGLHQLSLRRALRTTLSRRRPDHRGAWLRAAVRPRIGGRSRASHLPHHPRLPRFEVLDSRPVAIQGRRPGQPGALQHAARARDCHRHPGNAGGVAGDAQLAGPGAAELRPPSGRLGSRWIRRASLTTTSRPW